MFATECGPVRQSLLNLVLQDVSTRIQKFSLIGLNSGHSNTDGSDGRKRKSLFWVNGTTFLRQTKRLAPQKSNSGPCLQKFLFMGQIWEAHVIEFGACKRLKFLTKNHLTPCGDSNFAPPSLKKHCAKSQNKVCNTNRNNLFL